MSAFRFYGGGSFVPARARLAGGSTFLQMSSALFRLDIPTPSFVSVVFFAGGYFHHS